MGIETSTHCAGFADFERIGRRIAGKDAGLGRGMTGGDTEPGKAAASKTGMDETLS